ncbi:hypothetical protein K438DRAFT_1985902 [Mycena galopus ATCC 62051]|nr:hypothetical protein K438DRAFT_1985902 [Mycena galopus ATCC 62051]
MAAQKHILITGPIGAKPGSIRYASPYTVRALTRDPNSKHKLELTARGVECMKGSVEDLDSVSRALEGAYAR